MNDCEYVLRMNILRIALIQLLTIAGTGPIFGPIMGALFGPVAFLWIVLGSIFAGAVHDYLTGMISIRNKGAHIPELAGKFLGTISKHVVNIFALRSEERRVGKESRDRRGRQGEEERER